MRNLAPLSEMRILLMGAAVPSRRANSERTRQKQPAATPVVDSRVSRMETIGLPRRGFLLPPGGAP